MRNKMIRSVTIRSPLNNGKLQKLKDILHVYQQCVNYFVHRLWSEHKFDGSYVDSSYVQAGIDRFGLTARLTQCAGKQALEIVKSQRKKKERIPRLRNIVANLDSRFWSIMDEYNSFHWIKFQSDFKFFIPFKKISLWAKWEKKGYKLSKSMRLRLWRDKLFFDFFFEKDKTPIKTEGRIAGMDLGYIHLATLSDGQQVGTNMNEFIKKFTKREKNTHEQITRKCYEELKRIDFSNIRVLVLEDLKNVKKRGMFPRTMNRRLSHWLYAKVMQWLEHYCEEHGIRVVLKSPWKTSQYCSHCNNWDKRNRVGERFRCVHCGHEDHADRNAARNLELLELAGVYSLRSLINLIAKHNLDERLCEV